MCRCEDRPCCGCADEMDLYGYFSRPEPSDYADWDDDEDDDE